MEVLRTYLRRTMMLAFYLLAGSLLVGTAVVWLPVTAVIDAVRKTSYLRCICFFAVFLWVGLFHLAWVGVRFLGKGGPFRDGGHAYLTVLWAIQLSWGNSLFRAGCWLFRLRVEVEGAKEAMRAPGPVLVFSRHVSFVDTILPFWLFKPRPPFQPRYIMKRELKWDPCIDIVGGRLPNAFVRRNSSDPAREVAVVTGLMDGIGPADVVIIYPEGTRFTPRKRQSIIDRLREKGDEVGAVRAEAYTNVLPPRPGGALGLIEKRATDVIFLAHTGLERIRTLRNIVDGSLVGTTLRLALWRISAQTFPAGREALTAWLYTRWSEVDEWVGRAMLADASPRAAGPGERIAAGPRL